MKRTTATLMLLSCLGGCMTTDSQKKGSSAFNTPRKGMEVPGAQGPDGTPVMVTKQSKEATEKMAAYVQAKKAGGKAKADGGVVQASAKMTADPGVVPASGYARIVGGGAGCADGNCGGGLGGMGHGGGFVGHTGGFDPAAYGPMASQFDIMRGQAGIMPVPAMGVPGAVAAIGAIGPGSPYGPTISNQRTSIKFVSPERVRISWLSNGTYADTGLVAPAAYNFMQGNVYRLKLTGVPTQAGKTYYPTLEIAPATLKTVTFLSHNAVPVAFTNDDFDRVNAGNMVIKVIYLPDPAFQDAAALGGAEEVVSTQLEPGADPIVEATRRGTILAVIRLGNINLENPSSPAMDAVPPGGMAPPPGMMMPPGMTPPATMPKAMPPVGATVTPPAAPTTPISLPSIPNVK